MHHSKIEGVIAKNTNILYKHGWRSEIWMFRGLLRSVVLIIDGRQYGKARFSTRNLNISIISHDYIRLPYNNMGVLR